MALSCARVVGMGNKQEERPVLLNLVLLLHLFCTACGDSTEDETCGTKVERFVLLEILEKVTEGSYSTCPVAFSGCVTFFFHGSGFPLFCWVLFNFDCFYFVHS